MKKYLLALIVSFSLVGCTNLNEMEQDVKDGINDMDQDIKDYSEDMNPQNTSNVYGLKLKELWTVPSFCNATIGTTLFRGY